MKVTANSNKLCNYWKIMKSRLAKGEDKLVTTCNQLKITYREVMLINSTTEIDEISTEVKVNEGVTEF